MTGNLCKVSLKKRIPLEHSIERASIPTSSKLTVLLILIVRICVFFFLNNKKKKTEVEINILQSMIKHNHIDVIWWKLYIGCWICACTLWCMSIWLLYCDFQFKNEKKNGKKIRAKTLTPQSVHNILSAKSKKHHNQIQSSWISIWEC